MANSLHQPIELEMCCDSNDDSEFMQLVGSAVSGELEAKPVQEVFLIRINNWFDHQWLNFSGIGRAAFGSDTGIWYNPDTALEEFRQAKTGAKAVDELNEAAKKAGQNTMAYNTPDSFEKVYEFFKSRGTEEQRAHRVSARGKFAMIVFKDTGYTVAISWKEDAKSNGTVIHVAKDVPAR
jgi:hypothetical protein